CARVSTRCKRERPSSSIKALSRPMRELLPPATTKAEMSAKVVTVRASAMAKGQCARRKQCANLLHRKYESNLAQVPIAIDDSGCLAILPTISHAPEDFRRAYARSLLPRVFLASAGGRWPLLPGLPVVRSRVQVRLE